jgi:hypothetical protein
MTSAKTSAAKNTSRQATPANGEHINASRRLKTALVLLALVAGGFAIYQMLDSQDTANSAQNELYMPIADPALEPDRPDLIGDSLSDE